MFALVTAIALAALAQFGPDQLSYYEHLKHLEPLAGEWIGKDAIEPEKPITILATNTWNLNKNLMEMNWRLEAGGQTVELFRAYWAWDPTLEQVTFRLHRFDGGYVDGVSTKEGDLVHVLVRGYMTEKPKEGDDPLPMLMMQTAELTFPADDQFIYATSNHIMGGDLHPPEKYVFERKK